MTIHGRASVNRRIAKCHQGILALLYVKMLREGLVCLVHR
jgi:hypothetical protein